MTRKSGKKLALWMAPDATTTPAVTHLVATLVDVAINGETPEVDVGAAGDAWQEFIAGIPGGTLDFSGRLDTDGPQTFDEWLAGTEHKCRLLPDSADTGDYFEFNMTLTKFAATAARDGAWDMSGTGRIVAAPTYTAGV